LAVGCERAGLLSAAAPDRERAGTDERYRSTQHAIDAAAQAADVAPNGKSTRAAQKQPTAGLPKAHKMGPTRTTTRQATLTRGVEDKAADILALARSLVTDGKENNTLGRSTSTLRKTMRKTQTQRASTTSPTSKLRTTRWKSRTMQQLASGKRPELDFGATKNELASFDNDGQLMSIKDHCAAPPPEPRVPVIEPPSDVEALRRDYDARFSGLHAYGPTGATRLEELVEAALAASERAVAAYKAEKRAAHRSSSQIVPRATTCAALLASSGRVHVACAVRSNTDAALSVSAERAVVLRAVADGDRKFIGLVVADANSEELPVPDGAARQVLAEYGDFPVYLVNRDLRARRVTTHELFPLRVKAGHANANAPLNASLPATAGEALDDALTGHVAKAVRDTAAREVFDLCGNQISGAPRHRRDIVLVTASSQWSGDSTPSTHNLTHWLISTQVLTGRHGSPSSSPKRKSRRRSKSSDSDSSSSPKRKSRRDSDSDSSPERSRRRRSASSDSDASSRKEDSGSDIEATDKPADPRAWTVDDVAAFVLETTKARFPRPVRSRLTYYRITRHPRRLRRTRPRSKEPKLMVLY
jgi:cytidine deaminase